MLTDSGTSTLSDVALTRLIGSQTGGISTSFYNDLKHKSGVIADPDDPLLYFIIRGKAVYDKIDTLFEIMYNVLTDANLNNQKVGSTRGHNYDLLT